MLFMSIIKYLAEVTVDYWGDIVFPILIFIGLIVIFVVEKEKIKRYTYLWYSIVVLVFIYNPLTLAISRQILEESTFHQYYLRFFTLLPVVIIVAYMLTLLLNKLTGVRKLCGVSAACIIIAAAGNCIYTQDWYTKAENRNKVPQDVITICDLFADYDGDTIRIMAPQDIAVYLRQMDSRFSMPYARSLPDEAYELTNENPEVSDVVEYAKDNNVDYVVVSAVQDILDAYLNYGFTLYGRTAYYAVLIPNDPSWILTEYAMESGDQGMCYTLENINDGKLIVIDGGDADNELLLRDAIMEKGGAVDAWILTHYHQDHIDAFNAIYENPQGIAIKDIYVTPLDSDTFHSLNLQEWDDVDSFETFQSITEGADNIHYIARGDVLKYSDDLTITFINSCDEVVLENKEDIPNNVSLVFRIETPLRSILMCGDAHSKYLAEYLVENYGDELDVDILQCGHHGNNSMPEATGFYEAVSPEVSIFDTPDKIMLSPEYTAGALAAYLQELGSRIIWYKTAPNQFGF